MTQYPINPVQYLNLHQLDPSQFDPLYPYPCLTCACTCLCLWYLMTVTDNTWQCNVQCQCLFLLYDLSNLLGQVKHNVMFAQGLKSNQMPIQCVRAVFAILLLYYQREIQSRGSPSPDLVRKILTLSHSYLYQVSEFDLSGLTRRCSVWDYRDYNGREYEIHEISFILIILILYLWKKIFCDNMFCIAW